MTATTPSEDDEAVEIAAKAVLATMLNAKSVSEPGLLEVARLTITMLRAAGFVVARESALIAERDEYADLACRFSAEKSPDALFVVAKERDRFWKRAERAEAALAVALAERDAARAKVEWRLIGALPPGPTGSVLIWTRWGENRTLFRETFFRGEAYRDPLGTWRWIGSDRKIAAEFVGPLGWMPLPAPPDSAAVKDGGGL